MKALKWDFYSRYLDRKQKLGPPGQPQQLPISSGLAASNIRAGLRPISTNISSPAMVRFAHLTLTFLAFGSLFLRSTLFWLLLLLKRFYSLALLPPLMSHSVYLVPRGNLNHIQPASQPNLLHARSLTNAQSIAQGNGIAGVPAPSRPFSSTINNVAVPPINDLPVVKFIKQLMELSQKSTPAGTQDTIIKLVQRLIDDEIDCDSFCTQLCASLKSVNKRTDVESLLKNNIVQLRRDLANGVCSLPHITPPSRPPPSTPSTTVFVSPTAIINSVSSTSQILPRPSDGLPANATFQLSPAATVSLSPALPRSATPLVQNSIFSPRSIATSIAPSTPHPIRPQLKPSQPLPIRMKAPASSAVFQPLSGATAITPQRGSLLPGAAVVRPIYPTTPPSVSSVVPSPAPPVTPIVSAPGVSTVAVTATPAAASPSPSSQMNQPFFPVSQIRSYLATQLSQSSIAMISDEAINCMAHGLDAFLRSILARVSVVAGHKAVKLSEDPHLTQVDFAREQLNYLQRLGEFDRQKQSELEKEYILKAAKSRTRSENPDQARLREMAHQLKNEQYERERQQQANRTALNAIGLPANRRPRTSANSSASDHGMSTSASITTTGSSSSTAPAATTTTAAPRLSLINSSAPRLRLVQPSSSASSSSAAVVVGGGQVTATPRFTLAASLRTRRAGLRELQVVLSKDSRLCRSRAFFRSYWR
ncbi:Transcription initiation factor TFIID subunit 4B [Echinococcus granulosus]|uniref:Transcription initiation factor TFIID subunit 4B n=1 Tax=Echinococcus granulosus TaxID=6210 RepID=W6UW83_ECHGR|nr:Transcription initiation factor TFIID subunit 4B [Echinococcus granulosus]EUB62707.1 Transcription initiation factor TFIID subunit 4B [Echinococcus granulosus]